VCHGVAASGTDGLCRNSLFCFTEVVCFLLAEGDAQQSDQSPASVTEAQAG